MTTITKNNYEAFLLDFMEGTLSMENHAAMLLFLEQHPEIEFDYNTTMATVSGDGVFSFEGKEQLKRLKEEKEEELVYYLEGTLTKEEEYIFEQHLAIDAQLQLLHNQYQKTKLNPDCVFLFEDKHSLMKLTEVDEQLITYTENLFTTSEKEVFLASLQNNTELLKSLLLFKHTQLIADTKICYPHKENLKRSAIIVFLKSKAVYLSMAASLLLLFTLYYPSTKKPYNKVSLTSNTIKFTKPNQASPSSKNQHKFIPTTTSTTISSICKKPCVPNEKMPSSMRQEQVVTADTTTTICINDEGFCNQETVNINCYSEPDDVYSGTTSRENELSVTEKIATFVWKQKREVPNLLIESKKKEFTKMNLLALLANGLHKLGNKKSGAKKIYHEDEGYVEYNVTIAGITISKKQLN